MIYGGLEIFYSIESYVHDIWGGWKSWPVELELDNAP